MSQTIRHVQLVIARFFAGERCAVAACKAELYARRALAGQLQRPLQRQVQRYRWACGCVMAAIGMTAQYTCYLSTSADFGSAKQVPALSIFETSLRRGKFDKSRQLSNGGLLEFAHIYPMDAVYDTPEDVPEEVRSSAPTFSLVFVKERVHLSALCSKEMPELTWRRLATVHASIMGDPGTVHVSHGLTLRQRGRPTHQK